MKYYIRMTFRNNLIWNENKTPADGGLSPPTPDNQGKDSSAIPMFSLIFNKTPQSMRAAYFPGNENENAENFVQMKTAFDWIRNENIIGRWCWGCRAVGASKLNLLTN